MSIEEQLLILSLETATRAGGVAVSRGDVLLASSAGQAQVSHSAHLLEQIKSTLNEAGVTLSQIDLFAVAIGPGSFTGLRIGLATVKSFAATLRRKCVGIQTLHAVAHGAGASSCTVAMLPAGRGEVFVQRLSVSDAGSVQPLDEPTHQAPQKLLDSVAQIRHLKWAGEGAHAHAEEIKARALSEGIAFRIGNSETVMSAERDEWVLVDKTELLAVSMSKLAHEHVRSGDTLLPQDIHAIYVRPSDAEINK